MNTPLRHCVQAAILGLALTGPMARADGLVVITHPGVSLAADDIRDVFLGDKQVAGGAKLVPVDNGSAQEAFLARVVRLDAAKYNAAWTKKAFRDGINPPPLKASDAEVLEFVKRTPGAVAYVHAAPAAGVNVLTLK